MTHSRPPRAYDYDYGWGPKVWTFLLFGCTAIVLGMAQWTGMLEIDPASFIIVVLAPYLTVVTFGALHALAHVALAWLVNARIVNVLIGTMPWEADFKVGHTWIYLRHQLGPDTGGRVSCLVRGARWWRLRSALIAGVGPLVNLCAAAAAITIIAYTWSEQFLGVPVIVLGVVIVFGTLESLRPGRLGLHGLAIDVRETVAACRASDAQVAARVEKAEMVEELDRAYDLAKLEGAQFAIAHLSAAIPSYSDPWLLENYLFELMWDDGQKSDALEVLATAFDKREDDRELGDSANNRAWDSLMQESRTEEDLEAAEQAARLVVESSNNPKVYWRGTLGSILIERGNTEEGTRHLTWTLSENRYRPHRALNACYLAIAALQRDDVASAQHFLRRARQFDARCPLLQRAEQRLSRA